MTFPTTAVQTVDQVTAAIGPAVDVYNRLQVIKSVLAPDLNDQELQLFAIVAERSRLDPFAKQIYAIKRGGRVTFQTGIDGFRSSAEETGEYRGSDEPEYGPTIATPIPHPEWARVVVHREFSNGKTLAQPATAYWDEFYPGSGENGAMYRKMPRNQLAKCAEASAFRKAFPKRFSDVYTPEEMAQADAAEHAKPIGPTARERIADRRAAVEAQATAEPIEEQPAVDADFVELGATPAQETPASIVDRLKAAAAAHEDKASTTATAGQKGKLRDAFASIEQPILAVLLDKAFGLTAEGGKFAVDGAQAEALLEVYGADPDLFVVQAAAIAEATQPTS